MAFFTETGGEVRADVALASWSARGLAAMVATIGWAALALQLALIIDEFGPVQGTWRYLGYFTILTNIGAALVATAVALGSTGRIGGARARLVAATSIGLVGLVYSIALRSLWDPEGLQKLVDAGLHDATPLLFVLMWSIAPHGSLDRKDFAWALVPPALYAVYALARGAIDGWYAYWFFNPATQSVSALVSSVALLLGAVGAVAVLLIAIDRWKGS